VANLSTRKVDYAKFQQAGVQILSLSASNPFSQQTLADSLKLPYPLLSDFPDLQVIKSYGVLHPKQILARRAFFLIDKQGIVRGKWLAGDDDVVPSEPILILAREVAQKP
jgi:peroxiredoxin